MNIRVPCRATPSRPSTMREALEKLAKAMGGKIVAVRAAGLVNAIDGLKPMPFAVYQRTLAQVREALAETDGLAILCDDGWLRHPDGFSYKDPPEWVYSVHT